MRPGAEDLCVRLGLGGSAPARFPDGSQPVYAVGDALVLKLFPAAAAGDGVAERIVAEVGESPAVLHELGPEPLHDVLDPGDCGAFGLTH